MKKEESVRLFFLVREGGQQGAEQRQQEEITEDKQSKPITMAATVESNSCGGLNRRRSFHQEHHQSIEQESQKSPGQHSSQDIGDKVHPQIDARVAVKRSPAESGKGNSAVSEQQGEKHGQAEAVGGMSGDKAISTPPIAVDNINQFFEVGVMGRPITLKKRLTET